MPLFQLIERYPLGIECASKKCVALYDGLIFFFHNGSLSSYWVKTDGSWHCARYMLKGTVWSPCWMRKNVSDATVCPYISLQCGIGRFCASGKWSALGRYWYGTETIPCLRLRKGPNGDWSGNTPTCVGKTLRDYSLFLLSRQNNIETSSFSDTSCSPDNSMSWRFGSPMP